MVFTKQQYPTITIGECVDIHQISTSTIVMVLANNWQFPISVLETVWQRIFFSTSSPGFLMTQSKLQHQFWRHIGKIANELSFGYLYIKTT